MSPTPSLLGSAARARTIQREYDSPGSVEGMAGERAREALRDLAVQIGSA